LLKKLENAHPQQAEIYVDLANGAFKLLTTCCHAARLDDAAACFEVLKRLEGAHPEYANIRVNLARGAFNLAISYAEAGSLPDARSIIDSNMSALTSSEFNEYLSDITFSPP
jgi:hypothetical protein